MGQQQGYPVQGQQQFLYPQQQTLGQGYNGLYPAQQTGLFGAMARDMDEDTPAVDMSWVENTLIIQQDRNVQDSMDDAKSLQCEWRER